MALAGVPQSDDDLIIYTLNGLGPEFKENVAAVRAHDSLISFEELHEKLLEHEASLKRDEMRSVITNITVNKTHRSGNQGFPFQNRNNQSQ